MLKRLAVAVMGVLLATGSAAAFQCPLLIRAARVMRWRKINPSDAKVKEVRGSAFAEAGASFIGGHVADSIATAEKAARVLGVSLKVAKMAPAQEEQVRAAEQRIGQSVSRREGRAELFAGNALIVMAWAISCSRIDGIEMAMNSGDVQKPNGRAFR